MALIRGAPPKGRPWTAPCKLAAGNHAVHDEKAGGAVNVTDFLRAEHWMA